MKISIIILIIILFIIISVGVIYWEQNSQNSLQNQFRISSLVDYNASLCGSIGGRSYYKSNGSLYYNPNGFNSGIKLTLKDKLTGEVIQGSALWYFPKGGGGSLDSEYYSCEEGTDSEDVLISADAKGYDPSLFILETPKNQLATVEALMVKSCSGGPSFFDNLEVSAKFINNQTLAKDYIQNSQDRFYEIIKEQFNLEKTDYTLDCAEGDLGRGGYIKAKGKYKDGSPLELYYHWGWCTSGGTDCGWTVCFNSTSDNLFESVKSNFCNEVSSKQLHDDYICTSGSSYDNTEEVRNECNAGEFDKVDGSMKVLSIIQISNRCADSVGLGEFNCLEN